MKGTTKIEKENDNLKKRLSKVEEMKLETQRDIAAKRLKNTELILEQRKLDREIKEQEKQHKEHLMIKKTELRTKEKAMEQLMKDQAKAKQLEEHHKRIHSFSQKFCGTGRPDYRTGRFPHLSAPFAGMNADNPFLAEAIAEAARKTAASAKVDAEKKKNKYMKTFNDILSINLDEEGDLEEPQSQFDDVVAESPSASVTTPTNPSPSNQLTLTQTNFVRPCRRLVLGTSHQPENRIMPSKTRNQLYVVLEPGSRCIILFQTRCIFAMKRRMNTV